MPGGHYEHGVFFLDRPSARRSATGSTPDNLSRGMERVDERASWVFTISDLVGKI